MTNKGSGGRGKNVSARQPTVTTAEFPVRPAASISEDTIRAEIENYLAPQITGYRDRLQRYARSKIVRDAIWGFNVYKPHELALIDSPPFQRLRNIFQTSLALFTYPCSVHSRFEHSLGAATIASRMLAAIKERSDLRGNEALEIETRIAALLHDLGHGPFSHSSEKFYERLTTHEGAVIFDELKRQNSLLADSSASEIITYLMITTKSFRELWNRIVEMYRRDVSGLDATNLDRIASMILGIDEKVGGQGRVYRQIVNGPFDADKLDYLPRDGYFTGLGIVVDIERLLHTITMVQRNGERDIAVVASGASVLEQVLFAKTQLYSSVYHHHKVRAAHRLLMQLLDLMTSRRYEPAGRSLSSPVSYLVLDDYDLLHPVVPNDPDVNALISKIKQRVLPKRALVISYPCFDRGDTESRENFDKLFGRENETTVRGLEAELCSRLALREGEVMVDLPDLPRMGGTGQAIVKLGPGDRDNVALQTIYPIGAWAKAYEGYRKVAYVFTTIADRRKVGMAAREAFARLKYPVRLNEKAQALANY
jgi:uncharacterized protein